MGKYYEMHRHAGEPGSAFVMIVDERDIKAKGGVVADRLPVRTPEGMPFPHSPDGHEWGYGGSGPSQLAHDVLFDYLGRSPNRRMYMAFRDSFIADQQQDSWELAEEDIRAWVDGWLNMEERAFE